MTTKVDAILAALIARAETLNVGSPALVISYPEQHPAFDPTVHATAGKYLDITFFPNNPAWEGLTSGMMEQGLLQITVVWPKNRGLIAPLAIARGVAEHFAKGHEMFGTGVKVKVSQEPRIAPDLALPSEVRIPVTIPWTASAV